MPVFFLTMTGRAAAQSESGNYCVQDYRSGATCTANDVRLERLDFVEVISPCTGIGSTATVVFDALLSADGSPNRYDIGFFIATDGTTHDTNLDPSGPFGALGGDSCYHDYLDGGATPNPVYEQDNLPIGAPDTVPDTIYDINFNDADDSTVFGGWWNGNTDGDTCGDIEQNRAALTRLQPMTITCVDNDGDGAVDISVCASWDNNTNTACSNVQSAIPGTGSKCSCSTINLPFAPTAVTLSESSAATGQAQLPSLLAILGALATGIALFTRRRIA
jgi:hypothetical protein